MRQTLRCLCGLLFVTAAWLQPVSAQDEIKAQIQKTATPPVIDGLANDAVWSKATPHGMDEFTGTGNVEGANDLDVTWRALWDDQNLYVMINANDDVINYEDSCDWNDDSVEIYLDAQNLDVTEYNIGGVDDDVPAYQFTGFAKFDDPSLCARTPFGEYEDGNKSWFTWGVNSYDDGGDETTTRFPQGTDTSRAVVDPDNHHWSFEVAFPWTSLEETPANIIKNGAMGFGVAYNEDDSTGPDDANNRDRDDQPMWGTDATDLWHNAASMPSVALSTELVTGGGKPGDFNNDGVLDAADINALSAAVRGNSTDAKFDVNADGKVNGDDRGVWVNSLRKTYPGDATLDGQFDSDDFVSVFVIGKYETGAAANWDEGDWDGDGLFTSSDFVESFIAGGYDQGPRASVAAVPEPASLTLSLLGLGCLSGMARRRRA